LPPIVGIRVLAFSFGLKYTKPVDTYAYMEEIYTFRLKEYCLLLDIIVSPKIYVM
jgi:hypothetical protein